MWNNGKPTSERSLYAMTDQHSVPRLKRANHQYSFTFVILSRNMESSVTLFSVCYTPFSLNGILFETSHEAILSVGQMSTVTLHGSQQVC